MRERERVAAGKAAPGSPGLLSDNELEALLQGGAARAGAGVNVSALGDVDVDDEVVRATEEARSIEAKAAKRAARAAATTAGAAGGAAGDAAPASASSSPRPGDASAAHEATPHGGGEEAADGELLVLHDDALPDNSTVTSPPPTTQPPEGAAGAAEGAGGAKGGEEAGTKESSPAPGRTPAEPDGDSISVSALLLVRLSFMDKPSLERFFFSRIVSVCDHNRDGRVDREEFLLAMDAIRGVASAGEGLVEAEGPAA